MLIMFIFVRNENEYRERRPRNLKQRVGGRGGTEEQGVETMKKRRSKQMEKK